MLGFTWWRLLAVRVDFFIFRFFPSSSLSSSSSASSASSLFFYFYFSPFWFQIWTKVLLKYGPKLCWKKESFESQKPVTVLRIIRSNHDSHGSLPFSHRTVFEAKKIAKLRGSQFSRLDRTVRSGFQNLGNEECRIMVKWLN